MDKQTRELSMTFSLNRYYTSEQTANRRPRCWIPLPHQNSAPTSWVGSRPGASGMQARGGAIPQYCACTSTQLRRLVSPHAEHPNLLSARK